MSPVGVADLLTSPAAPSRRAPPLIAEKKLQGIPCGRAKVMSFKELKFDEVEGIIAPLLRRCYAGDASSEDVSKRPVWMHHPCQYLRPDLVSDSTLVILGLGPSQIQAFRSLDLDETIAFHEEKALYFYAFQVAVEVGREFAALPTKPIVPLVAAEKVSNAFVGATSVCVPSSIAAECLSFELAPAKIAASEASTPLLIESNTSAAVSPTASPGLGVAAAESSDDVPTVLLPGQTAEFFVDPADTTCCAITKLPPALLPCPPSTLSSHAEPRTLSSLEPARSVPETASASSSVNQCPSPAPKPDPATTKDGIEVCGASTPSLIESSAPAAASPTASPGLGVAAAEPSNNDGINACGALTPSPIESSAPAAASPTASPGLGVAAAEPADDVPTVLLPGQTAEFFVDPADTTCCAITKLSPALLPCPPSTLSSHAEPRASSSQEQCTPRGRSPHRSASPSRCVDPPPCRTKIIPPASTLKSNSRVRTPGTTANNSKFLQQGQRAPTRSCGLTPQPQCGSVRRGGRPVSNRQKTSKLVDPLQSHWGLNSRDAHTCAKLLLRDDIGATSIFQLGLLNKVFLAELIKELSFIGRKIIQLAWSELRGMSYSFRPKSSHFNSNAVSSSVIAI